MRSPPRSASREAAEREALSKRLGAMAREGQLLVNRANEYCLIDRLPVVVGTVSGHRDGFGFLVPDDGSDDLFLPYREMRMLFHGDRAAGRVTGRDERGRSEGAIVEVLEHRTRQVAGRFSLEGGIGFVTPDNRRISQRVVVPREATGPARHGDLAVVEITEQPSRNRDAVGRVLRVLPDGGGADTAIDLAIASHGLSHAFSPEALAEARGYGREVTSAALAGREDLRKMPLVTIDGEDARDFDDAVWAEENAGGFRLIVAIADVSHYVRPGTALDREARERATSVYFPNRVLPMLPEELSNHLCSLMPDVDRLCMVCDMQVTRAGDVSRSRFYPAVMRSAARLTYTRVAAHLDGREPASRGGLAAVAPVLDCLHQRLPGAPQAARAPRRARLRGARGQGARRFRGPGHRYPRVPAQRRSPPDRGMHDRGERRGRGLSQEAQAARALPHPRKTGRGTHRGAEAVPFDARRALRDRRRPEARAAAESAGRDLGPAGRGRSRERDHPFTAAGALPAAQHRPLRPRARGIRPFHLADPALSGPAGASRDPPRAGRRNASNFVHSAREMEALGQECSMRERRADEAARSVVAWLKCEYMRPRVGEEFDAVATGVAEFGVFVQLKEMQVDGLVHVTALPADYFHFHERDRTLVGERTKLRISIGDEMRVRLVRVDSAERKIDFEHVAKTGTHHHPRRRSAKAPARHK